MEFEPETDDRTDLPPDFSEHLASVGNLETRPETLGEYWSMFAEQYASDDRTIEPVDLYSDAPTRHEVHVNDRINYAPCILDAIGAAVMEPQGPVTVRSVDPVTRVPVTFTVEDGSVDVTPEEAVISFGIAGSIPELSASDESVFSWMLRADDPDLRDAFCRYSNAFESAETYDQWAAETDGESIPMEPASVGRLVRGYVDLD